MLRCTAASWLWHIGLQKPRCAGSHQAPMVGGTDLAMATRLALCVCSVVLLFLLLSRRTLESQVSMLIVVVYSRNNPLNDFSRCFSPWWGVHLPVQHSELCGREAGDGPGTWPSLVWTHGHSCWQVCIVQPAASLFLLKTHACVAESGL